MRKILFIILFLLLSIFIGIYFEYKKSGAIRQHLEDKTKQVNLFYASFYHEYLNLSHMIFDTQINTQDVIDIFKDAYRADGKRKNIIRENLYLKLIDDYTHLKSYNIRQLHFHLPNNESFLRFHRPKIFGDNLTEIRPTVAYVNKHKIQTDGFEEGRILNGYRFVYPLFNENKKHIGSVEVSFSAKMIVKEMIEHFKLPSNLLILKSIINEKIFDSEKSNYLPSTFKDYYFEKEVFDCVKKNLGITQHLPISEASKKLFYKNIAKKEPFSIHDGKSSNIITFIPIENPITKKLIGAVSIRNSGVYIEKRSTEFYWYTISIIILTAIILYIIYREIKLKEELQLNNKKLHTVIDEADSGIGVMDLEGNFLEVNQVYSDLLGYSRDELLQLSCVKLTKQEDRKLSKSILSTAKREGKISKIKKTCIKKDGSEVYLELSLTLLPSKEAFAAVVNSLEETKKLEELTRNLSIKIREEVQKNREKEKTMLHQSRLAQMGEMISMIAHQWRQPLSAISAVSADLGTKIMLGAYDKKLFQNKLKNISEYSQHLSKTIDDFRDFYKSNKEKRSIMIEDIFNSALNIIEVSIKNKNIKIRKEFDCSDTIQTYPNELKQVVLNLIKNAEDALLEHEVENPTIVLKTIKDEKYIYLIVSDNAGGVPNDIIENIFEPYYTTKEKRDGTGLGLYMSKIIIQDHCKGFLTVENSNIGAVFSIRIPLNSKDNR